MSPSLGMMLQMAPKIRATESQDKDGRFLSETMERIVFNVLSMKYGDTDDNTEPLAVDVDRIVFDTPATPHGGK